MTDSFRNESASVDAALGAAPPEKNVTMEVTFQ